MLALGNIFIVIILGYISLNLLTWHISIIEELEIKEKLCETVKTVLTCYTMCNMISLICGILFFFLF